jgi:Outer membrane lipoprotein-sorting protein
MKRILPLIILFGLQAQAQTKTYTGPELIAAAKAAKPKGDMLIRLRFELGKTNLLVNLKRRAKPDGSLDQVYTVTFPKDRKGEAFVIKSGDNRSTAMAIQPGQPPQTITASDHRIFGSDLTLQDALADFLNWPKQKVTGEEKVGSVACSIVESTANNQPDGVTKVKSWIEQKRFGLRKVQILGAGGKVLREMLTERVLTSKSGYDIPRQFSITTTATSTTTNVEGTGANDEVSFTDADFDPVALSK